MVQSFKAPKGWYSCQHRRRHDLELQQPFKLQAQKNIDRDRRTPTESESWNKLFEHSDKQARIRAVQMHLSCITTLAALPISLGCCERKALPAAPAAVYGLATDEIEREWIYDTGAAETFIGWNYLTDEEKSRTYKVETQKFGTAGGTV